MKLWRRLMTWWPLMTRRQHTVQVQQARREAANTMRIERDMWRRTAHLLREVIAEEAHNANGKK